MTDEELNQIITSGETYRVECTRATHKVDKFREAICSFSNDLSNAGLPGYLIIGYAEDDQNFRLKITDQLQQDLASFRTDGQILPQPKMNVQVRSHPNGDGEVLVVEVFPHELPPIRYKGRTCIRIGPRKAYASPEEERQLMERRSSHFKSYDSTPCPEGEMSRLDLTYFQESYRSQAIAREVIQENSRSMKEQLAALRFYNLRRDCPTNAGMICFAIDPLDLFPGAVVQYIQFHGQELDTEVISEKRFSGNLTTILRELDYFLEGRFTKKPVKATELTERLIWDYPGETIRELLMNALLHRSYESSSPIRFYQFSDRIEIQNPGGLFGEVTPENFSFANDYRNPVLAEVMYNLGYVNRFGRGIAVAQKALKENGSPVAQFEFPANHFLAVIPKHIER